MASESEKTNEVKKFAVMVAIAIAPALLTYGALQNRVSELEKDTAKNAGSIELLRQHNQNQDVETAEFRTEIKSRMSNVEKLTEDIHRVIVGGD